MANAHYPDTVPSTALEEYGQKPADALRRTVWHYTDGYVPSTYRLGWFAARAATDILRHDIAQHSDDMPLPQVRLEGLRFAKDAAGEVQVAPCEAAL